MSQETLLIRCTGSRDTDLEKLHPFQGDLKTLSKENFRKLHHLITNQGFSFPIFVWLDQKEKKNYIIDGHQRVRVLQELKKEGWKIPKLPIADVYADSYQEAKEKLLSAASQFGDIDSQGLYEYIAQNDYDIDFINESYDLKGIDFQAFEQEYFNDQKMIIDDQKDLDSDIGNSVKKTICPNCNHEFYP